VIASQQNIRRWLGGTGPNSIIIDDENAACCQVRVQVKEFMFRGLIPIRIEAQHGNSFWCMGV